MAGEKSTPLRLSLLMLGPFQAKVGSEPLTESRSKRNEALLAYLALEADVSHRRENLVGLLFPELPDEQARTNLRQTLTRLRRAIGDSEAKPPFLLVTRESTQFNIASDQFVDVLAFQELADGCPAHSGRRDGQCLGCMRFAQEALDLYRGPFLDGFFLEDSAAFDDWLLSQRERLQQMALAIAAQLVEYYERRGDYPAAELAARRQIELEPWREEAHRSLMRLLAYQGRRGEALRQYERLVKLLANELSIEPMPATEKLRRQIVAATDIRRHNLPQRDDGFVGRVSELAAIHGHLANPERRLISLIGTGGCGKTALALESGWQAAELYLGPFMHGVFMVPLVGISGATKGEEAIGTAYNPLATAVAEALDFRFGQDPQREVMNYLNDKELLLILDNVEHLVDAAREFVLALLRETSRPKVVVTSRVRLNLADEWLVEVSGLPVPDPSLVGAPLLSAEAPQLFIRRAQRLVPDISTPDRPLPCPAETIVHICRLVQGLPLGVELAASWVRHLSCQEIATELENSLDFLRSSAPDKPERHQSLRAIFDYSWELLDDSEREALRRLAVFSGAFDRLAAQAITGATIHNLAKLADHSLLQRRAAEGAPGQRYELLESLRQFAAEKLTGVAGESSQLRARYRRYYLDYLARRLEELRGERQQSAVWEIALEAANVRTAWRLACEQGDVAALSKAQQPLSLFYYMRSWFSEAEADFALAARHLAQRQLDSDGEILQARLQAWQGWFGYLRGRVEEGRQLIHQAVDVLRQHDATAALGEVLPYLAIATSATGGYVTAERLAGEAQQICRQHGDQNGLAVSVNVLSQVCYQQGDYERARSFGQESLALLRESGNLWSLAFSLTNLGRTSFAAADFGEASAYYREAIDIRKSLGDARGTALGLLYLGDATLADGQQTPARQAWQRSLSIFRDIGSRSGAAEALVRLGHVAGEQGDVIRARRAFAEAMALAREGQVIRPMLDALRGLARLEAGERPEQALLAARLVAGHPATGEGSRSAARQLIAQLDREDEEQALAPEEAASRLQDVADMLLRSGAAA